MILVGITIMTPIGHDDLFFFCTNAITTIILIDTLVA